MTADFLDTSALAKHYHAEVGSAEIDQLWNDAARGLFVSRLSAVEMVSVFAGKGFGLNSLSLYLSPTRTYQK